MTLQVTTGEDVVLERSYLERGWVDHAYANTIHTVQGATADDVMLVGPAGLYLESAYVALSRARERTRIYLTVNQAAEINEAHRTGIPLPTEPERDPVDELLARINRSAAKDLVTLGFQIVATRGTAAFLAEHGVEAETTNKVYEGRQEGKLHIVDRLKNGEIALLFNSTEGSQAIEDSRSIRAVALYDKIPYFTTAAGAIAAVQAMKARGEGIGVRTLQG